MRKRSDWKGAKKSKKELASSRFTVPVSVVFFFRRNSKKKYFVYRTTNERLGLHSVLFFSSSEHSVNVVPKQENSDVMILFRSKNTFYG